MPGRGARTCAPTIYGRQRHMPPNPIKAQAPKSPLSAGEGWVRESRPAPANAISRRPTASVIPRPIPSFPPHPRHSRESGNPHSILSTLPRPPGFWIPACAGMTVGGVCVAVGWAAQKDSPSPNPLPLGEGFSLGGKRRWQWQFKAVLMLAVRTARPGASGRRRLFGRLGRPSVGGRRRAALGLRLASRPLPAAGGVPAGLGR